LSEISSTELSRLCVEAGNPDAWQEFIRRFQKPIALTVLRTCRLWGVYSQSVVDDLVQDTYLRLCADRCKILRNFVPDADCADPLAALVKSIAANVAHDHFRNRKAQKRGGDRTNVTLEAPNEKALSDLWSGAQELERDIQIREIERTLHAAPDTSISSTERLVFRLYFRQGMTASAIATVPSLKLSTKGVESAVHRVKDYLRSQLNPELQRERHPPTFSEGKPIQIPMKGEEA
jgi:RNA polymerase sigma-70 factor, ECF subfamily